jgi:proliferating cell nuclear antigen
MEAEFKDVELFKKIMDAVGALMSDVSLDFDTDGFTIKAMDPANIAMILFEGKKSLFSSFVVEKSTKLSVSLDDLNGILKTIKKDDKVRLNDSKNKLNLDIRGKNKMHFSIPLIDENYTAQKVPQLKFTADFSILGAVIKDAIKAANLVDDSIYFTVDGQRLIIGSRSEEKEFSEEMSMNENKELLDIKSEGTTRAKYSIEYLIKVLGIVDPEKPLKMSFSNNYPMKLEYGINTDASISFILANRIE